MAYRLVPEHGPGQFDLARTRDNLMGTYRYRGINQPEFYKDPVARRLLGNYLVLFEGLTQIYVATKDFGGAFEALQFAEMNIPPHAMDDDRMWRALSLRYRDVARGYYDQGNRDSSRVALENLLRMNPELGSQNEIGQIFNLWKAAEPDS
ncbi:MAG TPA: hypothetical protein DHW45_17725 [Candidatus Latescibacteria bacterium]|nr:hypothetical protein [Candidatus Latescibacterota bacterium]